MDNRIYVGRLVGTDYGDRKRREHIGDVTPGSVAYTEIRQNKGVATLCGRIIDAMGTRSVLRHGDPGALPVFSGFKGCAVCAAKARARGWVQ